MARRGRPVKLTDEVKEAIVFLRLMGLRILEIAERVGLSRASVCRALKDNVIIEVKPKRRHANAEPRRVYGVDFDVIIEDIPLDEEIEETEAVKSEETPKAVGIINRVGVVNISAGKRQTAGRYLSAPPYTGRAWDKAG